MSILQALTRARELDLYKLKAVNAQSSPNSHQSPKSQCKKFLRILHCRVLVVTRVWWVSASSHWISSRAYFFLFCFFSWAEKQNALCSATTCGEPCAVLPWPCCILRPPLAKEQHWRALPPGNTWPWYDIVNQEWCLPTPLFLMGPKRKNTVSS